MRHRLCLILLALIAAPSVTAQAGEDLTAWEAQQQAAARADAAHQALSARYTAIWATLDASQKREFSRQERAWLNATRLDEQRACVASARAGTEALVKSCEATVIERHLGSLAAPQRVATSS